MLDSIEVTRENADAFLAAAMLKVAKAYGATRIDIRYKRYENDEGEFVLDLKYTPQKRPRSVVRHGGRVRF